MRKILNFGHTFAHAFEASLGFSKKLNHGEAVILGIYSALKFSYSKKIFKSNEYNLVIKHLKKFQLPFSIKKYFSIKDLKRILYFMTTDKKNNSNQINLVLLKRIGQPTYNYKYSKKILRFIFKERTNELVFEVNGYVLLFLYLIFYKFFYYYQFLTFFLILLILMKFLNEIYLDYFHCDFYVKKTYLLY